MMPAMPLSGTKLALTAGLAALAILACSRLARPAPVREAEHLLRVGRLDAAGNLIDTFLHEHPADAEALRVRFFIWLKDENNVAALETHRHFPTNSPILPAALTYRDPAVRGNVARLIAENDLPVAAPVLIDSLDDPEPSVRRYGATVLGQHREATALKPLFQLLADDVWYVRAAAAEALGRLGNPRAAGWLVQLLNGDDTNVYWSAAFALRDVTDESTRSLLLHLMPTAPPARQFALAVALAKLKDPAALGPLNLGSNSSNATVRLVARQALEQMDSARRRL